MKEHYVIKIPISQINKLKKDPAFILILQLGRHINQLSFCQQVYLEVIKKPDSLTDPATPTDLRQVHNSFFFMCAVLYEAFKLIGPLGKEFRNYKSFREGLAKLNKDPKLNFLKEKVFPKMRSKFIYHVDPDPFLEALETYNIRNIEFIKSVSNKQGDIYFNLSDELVLNYIIEATGDGPQNAEEERKHYQEIVGKVAEVMSDYVLRASDLMNDYILRKLWKTELREATSQRPNSK